MLNLEQIEAAILSLPSSEFEQLRLWLLDLDYERWDKQIQQDIEDDKLAEELADLRVWFAEFDAKKWDQQFEEDVAAGRLNNLTQRSLQRLREERCNVKSPPAQNVQLV